MQLAGGRRRRRWMKIHQLAGVEKRNELASRRRVGSGQGGALYLAAG